MVGSEEIKTANGFITKNRNEAIKSRLSKEAKLFGLWFLDGKTFS